MRKIGNKIHLKKVDILENIRMYEEKHPLKTNGYLRIYHKLVNHGKSYSTKILEQVKGDI